MSTEARVHSICVVMNDTAAHDQALRDDIQGLRERGFLVRARATWEGGDAERFAREAARDGVDLIVSAGGDGTLNEVVNGLLTAGGPAPCEVAALPYGTGNDFVLGCGVEPEHPEVALEQILSQRSHCIDVGSVGDRHFINMASAGFGAEITTDTSSELKHLFGRAAYFFKALSESIHLNVHDVRLRAPGFAWAGPAHLVAIGNGRQTGGGWTVAPQARLDDGLLDVMVVPESTRSELVSLLRAARRGDLRENSEVPYWQVPWVEVDADEPLQVNLDGEPLEGRRFRFEARPRSLRFRLPDTAPVGDA